LAIEGKKVILVDANLRCSHVHNYFNYERGAAGLADLLANKATSRQALIRKKNGFHVIPAGIMDRGNPADLLSQPAYVSLINEHKAQYDYVVLTTPPILPVADSLAILSCVDSAYIVVCAGQSTVREVHDALERLDAAGFQQVVHGAVFSGVTC